MLRQVVDVMAGFNVENVDASWRSIEAGLLPVVGDGRARSVVLSENYYRTLREAAGVTKPLVLITDADDWLTRARVSLHVAGPIYTKTAIARHQTRGLVENALVRVAGAAARQSLDGGRTTLAKYVRAERIRWRRITSADPCDFCAMLRDRGAVYVERTVHFQSHDHCGCTAEPVFGTRRGGRL